MGIIDLFQTFLPFEVVPSIIFLQTYKQKLELYHMQTVVCIAMHRIFDIGTHICSIMIGNFNGVETSISAAIILNRSIFKNPKIVKKF